MAGKLVGSADTSTRGRSCGAMRQGGSTEPLRRARYARSEQHRWGPPTPPSRFLPVTSSSLALIASHGGAGGARRAAGPPFRSGARLPPRRRPGMGCTRMGQEGACGWCKWGFLWTAAAAGLLRVLRKRRGGGARGRADTKTNTGSPMQVRVGGLLLRRIQSQGLAVVWDVNQGGAGGPGRPGGARARAQLQRPLPSRPPPPFPRLLPQEAARSRRAAS